jgi:hypothetical protein
MTQSFQLHYGPGINPAPNRNEYKNLSFHADVWKSADRSASFLTLELDGVDWSASYPYCFTPPRRDLGTHWIGGWVDPELV